MSLDELLLHYNVGPYSFILYKKFNFNVGDYNDDV